jgi:hypothetical protein
MKRGNVPSVPAFPRIPRILGLCSRPFDGNR